MNRRSSACQTVVEMFEAECERAPDAVAIIEAARSITFAELNARANRVARRLHELGIGLGCHAGVLATRSTDSIVSLLAILKSGAVFVPLDPSHPRSRIQAIINAAQPQILLSQRTLFTEDTVPGVLFVDSKTAHSLNCANLDVDIAPSDVAYAIFTSGTSGRPKGVLIEHSAFAEYLRSVRPVYALERTDRVLQFTSIAVDASIDEIFTSLTAGATLVIGPDTVAPDPKKLLAICDAREITFLNLPTSYWGRVVDAIASGSAHLPASVRTVVIGGESVDPRRVATWRHHVGDAVRLLDAYGPTEATVTATVKDLRESTDGEAIPLGAPIGKTRIFLITADGRMANPGEVGEICIGGPHLARGYVDEQLTAERFVIDPFGDSPTQRMYRTGDLGKRLDDGSICLIGRTDLQVKIRGSRVELGDVESALRSLPGVSEAVVISHFGPDGGVCLTAFIQATPVSSYTTADVRGQLGQILPSFMVPSSVVLLEEIPRTLSGKADRALLSATLVSTTAGITPSGRPCPSGEIAEVVAGIWTRLLGRPIHQDSNFFDLGGHSLLAVDLVLRIEQELGVTVESLDLFEAPTLGAFVARVQAVANSSSRLAPAVLTTVPRNGSVPLSAVQRRLWSTPDDSTLRSVCHPFLAVLLDGPLNRAAFSRAFQSLADRHEGFRTRFVVAGGEPRQCVEQHVDAKISFVDLSSQCGSNDRDALISVIREFLNKSFDVSAAPLIRAQLIGIGRDAHALVIVAHPLVADDWSMGILLRDLSRFYFSIVDACPLIGDLEVQYIDFAAWQRSSLEGETLRRHVDYWRSLLATAVAESRESSGGSVLLTFDLEPPFEAISMLAHRLGCKVSTILLATFFAVLLEDQQGGSVTVGLPRSGRRGYPQIELVVGPFGIVLPIRVRANTSTSFDELVRVVSDQVAEAEEHDRVPFETLSEALNLEPSATVSVIRSTLFSFVSETVKSHPVLKVTPIGLPVAPPRGTLRLSLEARHGHVTGTLLCPAAGKRFTPEQLCREYQRILSSAIRDPFGRWT